MPVLPTHWLGRAEEPVPVVPELVEPVEPEPEPIDEPLEPEPLVLESLLLGLVVELEPEPEVLGLVVELDPELPPTLGLEVELPVLPELPALPELCAHDTVARPSRAAATAALSFFAITMKVSFGWGDAARLCMQAGCRASPASRRALLRFRASLGEVLRFQPISGRDEWDRGAALHAPASGHQIGDRQACRSDRTGEDQRRDAEAGGGRRLDEHGRELAAEESARHADHARHFGAALLVEAPIGKAQPAEDAPGQDPHRIFH